MDRLFDPSVSTRHPADVAFQPRSLTHEKQSSRWSVAGLFAGIGGIELGLQRAGMRAEFLCEWWDPARAVLKHHFTDVPIARDVRELKRLPPVDLVSAGFPCTDLSQAGRTQGITGVNSGLVGEVFRLLRTRRAQWVMFENVRNMLMLDHGSAMRFLVEQLEALGYRWAYRVVDSRFVGVPQRRQRVILIGSLDGDPRSVLLSDDAGERPESDLLDDTFGFYWTEGLRGLGWARDAVPTLKGGSSIGIPSPPAIWVPNGKVGHRVITPAIHEAEQMQGFDKDWTLPASEVSLRSGTRWKLVGNAVTVGISEWVAMRLLEPKDVRAETRRMATTDRWPSAACGANGKRWAVDVSMWPQVKPYRHLSELVDLDAASPLSIRAAAGFHERAMRGKLRFNPRFLDDLRGHVDCERAA